MSVKAILYGQNYTKTEINELLNDVQDSLEFDDTPQANSNNPVKSGGIYTALSGKQNTLNFDNQPTNNSLNMLTSGSIYTALSGKQNTLTIASTVSSGNNNPVSSDAVYTAIQGLTPGGESITVDSALSSTSTNPVQNKVIHSALANKVNTSDLADYATNSALSQKAPTNHASSATTYGVGTSSNYGHLKITDSISNTAASSGVAISPKAVNELRTTVLSKQDALSSTNVLPVTSGGTGNANLGTDSSGSTRAVTINPSGTALTTRPLVDSTTHTAFSNTSTNLITERAVYYALPKINNDHTYDSVSNFYAPTSAGTVNQILTSSGSGAPTWTTLPSGGFLSTNASGQLVGRGSTGQDIDNPSYPGVFNVSSSSSAAGTIPSSGTYTGAYMVFEYSSMSNWIELCVTSQRTGSGDQTALTPRLFQRSYFNGIISDWIEYVHIQSDGTIAASIIPNLNASKITAGTLPIARGGTGATSFSGSAVIMSNSAGTALQTRTLTNNTSNAAITASAAIPTLNTIYYGLPNINGTTYNRSTTIYAPTTAGTSGQILVSSGSGAPTWGSISSNLPSASTSTAGIVKLSSATNSASTSVAATASAVKSAYDLANGIKSNINNLTCKSFYDTKTITLSNVTSPFYFIMIYTIGGVNMEQIAGVKLTQSSGTITSGGSVTANFATSNKIVLTITSSATGAGIILGSDTFTIS